MNMNLEWEVPTHAYSSELPTSICPASCDTMFRQQFDQVEDIKKFLKEIME